MTSEDADDTVAHSSLMVPEKTTADVPFLQRLFETFPSELERLCRDGENARIRTSENGMGGVVVVEIFSSGIDSSSSSSNSSSDNRGRTNAPCTSHGIVLKSTPNAFEEVWAMRLARRMNISGVVPRTRLLRLDERTRSNIRVFIERGTRTPEAFARIWGRLRGLSLSTLMVQDFVPGARDLAEMSSRGSDGGVEVVPKVDGTKSTTLPGSVWNEFGQLAAFDMFVHNADGIPSIWRTMGNAHNVLFVSAETGGSEEERTTSRKREDAKLSIVTIDRQMPPLEPSRCRDVLKRRFESVVSTWREADALIASEGTMEEGEEEEEEETETKPFGPDDLATDKLRSLACRMHDELRLTLPSNVLAPTKSEVAIAVAIQARPDKIRSFFHDSFRAFRFDFMKTQATSLRERARRKTYPHLFKMRDFVKISTRGTLDVDLVEIARGVRKGCEIVADLDFDRDILVETPDGSDAMVEGGHVTTRTDAAKYLRVAIAVFRNERERTRKRHS